ncbi:alpha/beta hydrolase fold-3 domain-containing protein [Xylariaceae sp. FL1272]|nr:alpha/beta hydrolase fold-3 domain-containing protein [Xylariaceae sp. FL1272]
MTRPTDLQPRPPYDPAIVPVLQALGHGSERYEVDTVRNVGYIRTLPLTDALLANKSVRVEDLSIPGPRSNLMLTIVRPRASSRSPKTRPCIFYACDRYAGLDTSTFWASELDAITISVEYGRAPENTGEQPLQDCYAALLWVERNLHQLGIDPSRLILHGTSAGGGLAVAVRDKGGPKLCGLFLECPMLDDRNETISAQQYTSGPFYNSSMNKFAWGCLLGDRVGTNAVSEYEAPARAIDLTNLPPTFLDCASAEPFRDEIVIFASRLWAAGSAAELHVWPGGPHGYDRIAPKAPMVSREARLAWLRRVLSQVDSGNLS